MLTSKGSNSRVLMQSCVIPSTKIHLARCGHSAWLKESQIQKSPVSFQQLKISPSIVLKRDSIVLPATAEVNAPSGKKTRAVVIGAGMNGLSTSHVLRQYFDEVIMLERDAGLAGSNPAEIYEEMSKRKGVPQRTQLHTILSRGLLELEGLLPGISNMLESLGGIKVRFPTDVALFAPQHGYVNATDVNADGYYIQSSRSLIESCVRASVMKSTLESSPTYKGTLTSRSSIVVENIKFDGKKVNGVVLKGGETIDADLVVDCSGRGSKMPEWLAAVGLEKPELSEIDGTSWYCTQIYKLHPLTEAAIKFRLLLLSPEGPKLNTRFGMMLRIENGVWQVQLGGRKDDPLPKNDKEFVEFTKGLTANDIYEIIRHGTPVSAPMPYHRLSNYRRHYERINLPEGLICLGDSVCCTTPFQGLGVTVGLLQALQLNKMMKKHVTAGEDFAKAVFAACTEFNKNLGVLLDERWQYASGFDQRYLQITKPEVAKKPNFIQGAIGNYLKTVVTLLQDPKILSIHLKVFHLILPVKALFAPYIIFKVLVKWLFQYPAVEKPKGTAYAPPAPDATSTPSLSSA